MTVRDFCKSSSRFYYWQAKIGKEVIQQSGNFILVNINNRSGDKIVVNKQNPMHHTSGTGPATLEIVYPNGVILRITEAIALGVHRELIFMER